jgi:cytoskeletal protein RodZ
LDYVKDPQFEQEIENCTEFSGEFLKKIREYRNVDIIRMADMTKVSKTYLQNIEKEDTRNLPALVYVRGFVYQYAKCLKLNPELVATSYLYRLRRLKEEN